MSKILMMEGLDRSGKSELAANMSKMLDIPYYCGKRQQLKHQDIAYHVKYAEIDLLSTLASLNDLNLIIDRFHISELVYSLYFGRQIDEVKLRMFDNRFAKKGTIIIYIDTDLDIVMNRMKHTDPMNNIICLKQIRDYYKNALTWTQCEVIEIKPQFFDYQIDKMVNYIERSIDLI